MTTHAQVESRSSSAPAPTHELVAQISLTGEVMWASSALTDVLGWNLLDVVGHNIRDFIVSDDVSTDTWDADFLATGETFDTRLIVRHRDGSSRECRATFYRMTNPEYTIDTVIVTGRGFTSTSSLANPIADLDLYQILAENISDVVSMTEGAVQITWVSPSVETLLGWPASDVIGHTFRDFMFEDDLAILETSLARIWRGETVQFEVRLVRRDGEVRWTAIASHLVDLPGRDQVRIAVWRDVHEAVESRNSLIQSRQDFQRVAESASDVVIQTDIKGRIEWPASSVTTVLGWRSIDVLGKNILEFFAPHDAARAEAWQSRVLTGERVRSAQMRYRTASGESRWMAVRAQPLIDNRVTHGIITSLRDYHAEVVARRALNTLSAASKALTRSEDEQEFLNTMRQSAVNEGGYLLWWYARPTKEIEDHFSCVA